MAGVGLWLAGTGAAVAAAPLARGDTVSWPPLTLLDGSVLTAADWADTAAVIVFWATWCAYCRRHNAHINKLHAATAGQHLRVLGVAVDSDEAGVRRYMQSQQFQFPTVLDSGSLRAQFTTRRMVPMTVLVDRRGRLLQVIPGEMSESDVLGLAALARPPTA
jgi:thiol-disulfide isomerase/thioredoxin